MKNKPIYACLLLLTAIGFVGCKHSDDSTTLGNWIKRSDFDGYARSDAASFVINGKAYLGTGDDGLSNKLKDFWEYDPKLNAWQQKADFGGIARSGAVGFAASGAGFITTGYDGLNYLKDTWKYDPASNTWTQVADFGGTARVNSAAFGIGNKGYVTTGWDGRYLKDFWEYDPASNQWTSKVSMGGSKRRNASTFVVKGIAYLFGGMDNGLMVNDFWAYDPGSDTWTQKRNIDNSNTDETYDDNYTTITREFPACFTIGDTAYVATGDKSGSLISNVWQYDPTNDVWVERTAFQGAARIGAVSFSVDGRGFVVTGGSGGTTVYDDLWEFQPNVENNTND